MKTIKVITDFAPNGARVWTISGEQPNGLYVCKMVEKAYLDHILPPSSSNEEYWGLVAKHMSKVYFDMLDECGSEYNVAEVQFDCNGQIYKPKA